MLGASTPTALQRLSVFAFWVASASKTFSGREGSSRVSFLRNECIHIIMCEVIAVAEEHSSAVTFPFVEAKALDSPAESAHWLSCEASPHSLGSLVDPEDGFALFLLGHL